MNTDLNTTLALTIIVFIVIEVAGVAALGFLKYGKKFVNVTSFLGFTVGIIELFSELAIGLVLVPSFWKCLAGKWYLGYPTFRPHGAPGSYYGL